MSRLGKPVRSLSTGECNEHSPSPPPIPPNRKTGKGMEVLWVLQLIMEGLSLSDLGQNSAQVELPPLETSALSWCQASVEPRAVDCSWNGEAMNVEAALYRGGGGGSCECMRRSSCHNTGDLMHAGTTNIEHGRNAHAYTFHGPAARSTQTQTCPSKQPIRDSSKEVIHHHVYSHSIPQRVEMKGGGG